MSPGLLLVEDNDSFICKPTDFASFTESVTVLVTYWMKLNRPAHLIG